MKLGYAHQATGGLAIAQAVKELLAGDVETIKFVIANKTERRVIEVYEFGIGRNGQQTAVRFCSAGDPIGPGSHGVTRFDENPADPVVVASAITELLAHQAATKGAEVYRPLTDVNPDFPVFGAFEAT